MNSKALKKILIRTKKAIFSHKIGNNVSRFKGEGYDFRELREYEDGEDVRKIDWMISAKMGKPYVKVFHAQRELDINIVSLLCGSTYFGTSVLKQEVICEITSLLGYSAVSQGDNFSSFIANTTLTQSVQKTKNIFAVQKMAEQIYNYNTIGKIMDNSFIFNELYKRIKKKSIIFLIGDFINTDNINLSLLAKKHEVIAIIVRDQFEENPPALGNVNFIDPSDYSSFEGTLDAKAVAEYKEFIKAQDEQLLRDFKKWGVDYTKIYTHENIAAKLMRLFR